MCRDPNWVRASVPTRQVWRGPGQALESSIPNPVETPPLEEEVARPVGGMLRALERTPMTHSSTTAVDPAAGQDVRLVPIAVVGAFAGLLAGMFGVGGGILIVPGLVLAAGMNQRLAHGTSLAAVVPISMASLVSYAAHDNVDWNVAVWLAIGAVAGAVLGTRLLHSLPQRTLTMLFAAVLVVSALRLFLAADANGRDPMTVPTVLALLAIGLVTGTLAGLLGVGGGVVMVPAMILLFGIPPVIAKGTSAAVIIPAALMGTWRNRAKGNTDLRAAAVIGVAGVVTAAIGGMIADRMSDEVSNVLFASLLLIVAARLVWGLVSTRSAAEPVPDPAPE
jgi:uncharacterized membrane protein YfcA